MFRRAWMTLVVLGLVGKLHADSAGDTDNLVEEFDKMWYEWYREYKGCAGHLCVENRGTWNMAKWNKLKGLARKLWKD